MTGSGISLGKIFGVRVRVDWSWIFIFLLVAWNLITAFNQLHPAWNISLRVGLAIAAALLFFLSVLAHELAHSVVANSFGLPVKEIVLFLFGGVSNITREPESPKQEFLVAIAGPATSLLIGIVLLGFVRLTASTVGTAGGTALGLASQLSPLNTTLLWLGSINLILAVFNLIPGFPLDGGRVLRSILWAVTKSLRTATKMAAWVGQAIAWTMIIIGIAMAFGVTFPLLGTGLISGLWLAFIGWFLNSASAQSYQQVKIRDLLTGVTVSRIMRTSPPTVDSDCTINDLMHTHLMNADDLAFPVLDHDQLVGIISLEDVRHAPRDQWDTTYVSDVMTPRDKLETTAPEEDAADAMDKLMQRDLRQLPVVTRDSQFVGLLRRRDIMRWMQVHMQV